MSHPYAARVHDYARRVVAGDVLACRWVRLAGERHLADLERADFPYRFDDAVANRALRLGENFPHVKGKWAALTPGKPKSNRLCWEDWQCFVLGSIHGWVRKDTGLRRFTVAYLEVPRKNSKSTMAAVEGLLFLATDGEIGAEVYSGATSEKQAWEVFRPARQMAERTPDFLTKYGVLVNASNLAVPSTASRFEPVIGKPGDGASPSLAIVDEYHEHPDPTLYDTMETGMGARDQALMLVITTAGADLGGPCYALHEDVLRMLDGTKPNDQLFGAIWTLDDGDDWTTEAALRKANPNYGVSVNVDRLKAAQQEAIASARKQNVFKTKHLNIWVTARDAWMNMEWWNRQADASLRPEDFADCPCYAAVDLANKLDLAETCRVFRRDLPDGPPGEDGQPTSRPHYYAFWRHYLPSSTVQDPTNQHYQGWEHEGWLTVTDGDMTDHDRIRDDLLADARTHGLVELACDPWNSAGFLRDCQAEGLTVLEVPQTTKYFSEPMKAIEALVKSGQFHHAGDPVAMWGVSNVTVKEDPNENIFPRKERPEYKIDPATALIMAMGRALATQPAEAGAGIDFG